jgi:hypothetical protein
MLNVNALENLTLRIWFSVDEITGGQQAITVYRYRGSQCQKKERPVSGASRLP